SAGFNPFLIRADDVLIDLLTDSGTAAMSSKQWAGVMEGDESYAGARSFFRFEGVVRELTRFKHIIPTHQGRAAERILFTLLGGPGKFIPNNVHFDTTRANVEFSGAEAVDLLVPVGRDPSAIADFKGNMDIPALEKFIQEKGARNIPLIMLTVTNNAGGGQPVSMENIRQTREVASRYKILFFLDACRFAENAFFIKQREKGYQNKEVRAIAVEMFSLADGCTMSAKKDALVNTGGFLGLNDDELAMRARNLLVLTEGFLTYGGLAGRDLEAMAQGFEEVLDEHYLIQPPGGHAIYLDAKRFLPHVPAEQFPGQSIVCELYRIAGIRSVEIGSVMFGRSDAASGRFIPPAMELVRLAIPRRVYTQSHIDYVVESVVEVFREREKLHGYRIVSAPPALRHFTARFARLN
ncbi:MAG: tyrosine phenol-lyase, partial [Ignavibacteria bacterium 13_1_40CM_2_61_4]